MKKGVDINKNKKNRRWETKQKGQEWSIYNRMSPFSMLIKLVRFPFAGVSDRKFYS
jgi:hypothetical protein